MEKKCLLLLEIFSCVKKVCIYCLVGKKKQKNKKERERECLEQEKFIAHKKFLNSIILKFYYC